VTGAGTSGLRAGLRGPRAGLRGAGSARLRQSACAARLGGAGVLRLRGAGVRGWAGRVSCGFAGPGRRYPGAVRLTVFWEKMRGQFGEAYAASVAKDFVLTGLGGATVNQALAAGTEPKTVWLAVCEAFEIPEESR
jgi:hypothetical protein